MTKQLPRDTEAALTAIANGWGREPSAAHPECECFTQVLAHRDADGNWRPLTGRHDRASTPASIAACPIHGKAR